MFSQYVLLNTIITQHCVHTQKHTSLCTHAHTHTELCTYIWYTRSIDRSYYLETCFKALLKIYTQGGIINHVVL